ncbi:hypothetical protein RhiLY_06676 [Ceratobasidium sp. AG-Ba]|nr:hypothetical protein RhiLY_06676 [Ceratobasidium sp. AG-Ba]
MSEFPANKLVTLRYIPDITNQETDTNAPGGLYATAPDPMISNWLFVPDGRGIKVQLAPAPSIKTDGGPGPVELPHAWKNESKFSGPVALAQPDRASTYYLNTFKKSASGWIVT